MSFKRPYVPSWGRQRTQEEIDLDRRLEAAEARLAVKIPKIEWVKSQYRAASRRGLTKEDIRSRYAGEDLAVMDEHVNQMFWQMVRHEVRTNKTFVTNLQFIEEHEGTPQHEVLQRIMQRFWAKMQQWDDDKKHSGLIMEVFRAAQAARGRAYERDPSRLYWYQIRPGQAPQPQNPVAPPRRQRSLWAANLRGRRQRPNAVGYPLWHALDEQKQEAEESAIVPEMWEALDDEADHERQQKEWLDGVSAWYRRHD